LRLYRLFVHITDSIKEERFEAKPVFQMIYCVVRCTSFHTLVTKSAVGSIEDSFEEEKSRQD
jgi:hypothetical protein